MLRFFVLVLGILGILASAAVFDAASGARQARLLIHATTTVEELALRRQLLERAAAAVEASWSRSKLWHAGAADALSAAYAARAALEHGDLRFAAKSAAAASHAVALSPVQPRAWTRLAAFAQIGVSETPCSVAQCLAASWRAGRITDPQTACTRLRIASAEGLLTGPDDERITWYLGSGVGRREAARCLDFLPSPALFQRMLQGN
jgi:hypothetical protein